MVLSLIASALLLSLPVQPPTSSSGDLFGYTECRPWRSPRIWVAPDLTPRMRARTLAHERSHAQQMAGRSCLLYTLRQQNPEALLTTETRARCAGIAVAVRQGEDLDTQVELAIEAILHHDHYRKAAALGIDRVSDAVWDACADLEPKQP